VPRSASAGAGLLWIVETLRRFPVLELEDGSERLSLMFVNPYRAILVRLA
jgi:hypothetical protein